MERRYRIMEIKASDLLKEHKQIERELIELDTIMRSFPINYPNLLHVLKKLKNIWDPHEERESIYFESLYKKGFTIPIKKITFEHGKLRRDMETILQAFQSGNEEEMRTVLFKYGKDLINNIRQHIADEDWIFYALPERLRGE